MFDEDKARLIDRIATLSEENNKLLRKLARAQTLSTIWSVIRWAVIIALTLASYYYIQPYMDQLLKIYQDVAPQLQSVSGFLKQQQ